MADAVRRRVVAEKLGWVVTGRVPQRLRERPLAADRNIDRARRHRRGPLQGGCPRPFERGPGRAQAVRIGGAPVGAAGKAAVELRFDQRDHIRAVDAKLALAVEQPRCVDVGPSHVDRASRRRTG
jgi:hypothetical protein